MLSTIANTLNTFLLQAGEIAGCPKGDNLLRYYIYYRHTEKHPIEVFKMDEEFKKFHTDYMSKITDKLDGWMEIMNRTKLSNASVCCRAIAFVLDYMKRESKVRDSEYPYDVWFKNSISKEDIEYLKAEYSNEYSSWEMYYHVTTEFKRLLSVYMSKEVIQGTPIAILSLYYVYTYNMDYGYLNNMYTKSQGVVAMNTVKELCRDIPEGIEADVTYPEIMKVLKVYTIAERNKKSLTDVDSKSSNDIRNIVRAGVRADATKELCEQIVLDVAAKLEDFRSRMNDIEAVDAYSTCELLTSYIYYTCSSELINKCTSNNIVADCIKEIRSTLPSNMSELSDAAALAVSIVNLGSNEFENYYTSSSISEVLTEEDRRIIQDCYCNISVFDRFIKCNLSWFADTYWVRPITDKPFIEILARCATVTRKYRKNCKEPLLSLVDNANELRSAVDNFLSQAVNRKSLLGKLSPTGLLTYVVLCVPDIGNVSSNSPLEKIEMKMYDVEFIISNKLAESESDINSQVTSKLSQIIFRELWHGLSYIKTNSIG